MKAKKEHVDKELIVLKLFAINYAKDLIHICILLYPFNFIRSWYIITKKEKSNPKSIKYNLGNC